MTADQTPADRAKAVRKTLAEFFAWEDKFDPGSVNTEPEPEDFELADKLEKWLTAAGLRVVPAEAAPEVAVIRTGINAQNKLIEHAQELLTDYLRPDGPRDCDETCTALLELLDGPEQRETREKARLAAETASSPYIALRTAERERDEARREKLAILNLPSEPGYKLMYERMVAAETKWGLAEQRAEAAEARAKGLEAARDALAICQRTFEQYANIHRFKSPPDEVKASANDEMSALCRSALAALAPQGSPKDSSKMETHPIFRDHSCWKCQDGAKSCVRGTPNQCEYPHAKND